MEKRIACTYCKFHSLFALEYASYFRFTFTQLDAGEPTRSFSFVLNVNDEDRYEVEDTLPPVDSIILHELLEKLNETDDLSVFCRGMRKSNNLVSLFPAVVESQVIFSLDYFFRQCLLRHAVRACFDTKGRS